MNKTIWIVNQYASDLETGIGGRWYYLARELAKEGYNVSLFCSSNHHLLRIKHNVKDEITVKKIDGFTFVLIKGLEYSGAHDKKRILAEFDFSNKISKLYKHNFSNKPDVVIASTPSLIVSIGAEKLAKKYNSKFILDIRDIWPLTLTMMGYSKIHPFIIYLKYLEKRIYKKADYIISNLPYAINHIEKTIGKIDNFLWIPNGFDISEFEEKESLNKEFLEQIPKNKFIVGYTGTLGKANALHTLIDAAEILKEYKSIIIIIIGQGREKEELQEIINKKNLNNIVFFNSIAKKQVPSALELFDICYVGFLKSPLYEFGSSLTKLPEYLASCKPIVYGSSSTFQPVKEAEAGITIEAQNPEAVADSILKLYNMQKEERILMGEKGKKYALKEYEYSNLAKKLAKVF